MIRLMLLIALMAYLSLLRVPYNWEAFEGENTCQLKNFGLPAKGLFEILFLLSHKSSSKS